MTEVSKNPAAVAVRVARSGAVAQIEIDNPPVNAASQAVRAGIVAALHAAAADAAVAAIVIAGAGKTFVAGADIRELDGPLLEPHLPDVCAAIENCPKPVVAALNGAALGGGCELALASHGRIAAEGAVLGLPEVKLGLIPGAGGTQRLPRIVDVAVAFEIASSGRNIQAEEALRLGIVDAVVPAAGLRGEALRLAESLAGKAPRRTCARPVKLADMAAFEAAAAKAIARGRGQACAAALATAMTAAIEGDFSAGCATERRLFLDLRGSDQSKAMRHVFFAEREAGRLPELKTIEARPVARIGIVGAGTMGSGIAGACLAAGFEVVLADSNEEARERASKRIEGILQKAAERGGSKAKDNALTLAEGYDGFANCDLVIEAVFEDMAVKTALLAELARIAPANAVIATNTSYLDVNRLAEATGLPQDVIGLHFFAPAEDHAACRGGTRHR